MLRSLHYKDFYLELEKENRTSVVIFMQPRCGTCRRLIQKLNTESHSTQIFTIAAEDAHGLIEEWEIFHLPHVLLFKDGHFHRHIAVDWHTTFQEQINSALQEPPQEAPC